jgi:hypothetical protein
MEPRSPSVALESDGSVTRPIPPREPPRGMWYIDIHVEAPGYGLPRLSALSVPAVVPARSRRMGPHGLRLRLPIRPGNGRNLGLSLARDARSRSDWNARLPRQVSESGPVIARPSLPRCEDGYLGSARRANQARCTGRLADLQGSVSPPLRRSDRASLPGAWWRRSPALSSI